MARQDNPKKSTSEGRKEGRRQAEIAAKPALLSGGNPQIAKGDGDAPVQAYIAAMPGWKRDVGRRLDALIARTVPGVRKAVKWNSPFYGVEGQGWFLSFHCFTKYVKVAFFRGASLRPVPPGESKQKDVRYLDIHEDDELDEAQFAAWVKQASRVARRTHVSGNRCNEESDEPTKSGANKSRGGQTPRPADRCEDQGAGRLARRDARPGPRPHQAGRPRRGRGSEMAKPSNAMPAFRCGSTTASSAPARPTRPP